MSGTFMLHLKENSFENTIVSLNAFMSRAQPIVCAILVNALKTEGVCSKSWPYLECIG